MNHSHSIDFLMNYTPFPPSFGSSCHGHSGGLTKKKGILSGSQSARRESNPRPSPWQGDAPPLSHSRILLPCQQQNVYYHKDFFLSTAFFTSFEILFQNAGSDFTDLSQRIPYLIRVSGIGQILLQIIIRGWILAQVVQPGGQTACDLISGRCLQHQAASDIR